MVYSDYFTYEGNNNMVVVDSNLTVVVLAMNGISKKMINILRLFCKIYGAPEELPIDFCEFFLSFGGLFGPCFLYFNCQVISTRHRLWSQYWHFFL